MNSEKFEMQRSGWRPMSVLCCLWLVYCSQPTEGARILGLFALPGKSHFIMFQEVMKCLADAGHQVDVVSHFPQKKPYPNYTDISLQGKSVALMNSLTYEILKTAGVTVSMGDRVHKVGTNPCNLLDSPELQKLIKSPPNDPPYDLVITEYFFAHCYFAFGRHLGVPVIALASTATMSHANEAFGNPANTAIVSEIGERPVSHMNFWQRLKNTIVVSYMNRDIKYHLRAQNDIVRKHFGPEMPDIEQLEKELSLLLVNSHYIFHGIRPMTPAIVEVSGLHIHDDNTPLPDDLQKWLDDSKAGFIYFSLGSMARLESFPKEALAEIYSAFVQVAPIRILMKVSSPNELPSGLPDNVKTLTWAPQVQVLKHKNIRGFMTHGGLMGLQEAVTFGVPLIGIPLFGDQMGNIHMLVEREVALPLDYQNLKSDKIVAAINAVAFDPKYKQNMNAASKQFLDRPLDVRNTTVFWIEYILKHGKDALRSPALELTWWELASLDVYATITAVVLVFLYGIKFIFSTIIARLVKPNRTSSPSKKKN